MLTAKLALQISMSPQLPAGVDKVLQAINHTEYKYLAGGKKNREKEPGFVKPEEKSTIKLPISTR